MANQYRAADVSVSIHEELDELPQMNRRQALFWLIGGLLVLLVSARLLVWAASNIAAALGVSELIVGLTIVAVGTSLPELAATVGSAMKGPLGHRHRQRGGLEHPERSGRARRTRPVWRDCDRKRRAVAGRRHHARADAAACPVRYACHRSAPVAVITRFEGTIILFAWIGYNAMLFSRPETLDIPPVLQEKLEENFAHLL